MVRTKRSSSLKTLNAKIQAEIAVVLLAVIPSLSVCYICLTMISASEKLSPGSIFLIFTLTLIIAFSGFIILRKYPKNILKLRAYITEIAEGTLPKEIQLVQAGDSDDILYIEENFNRILASMRQRMEEAEEQLRVEHALRKTVEEQQEALMEAERQRVMIQTLGAACHHIGQPATVLQIQMDLLLSNATTDKEIQSITECAEEVHKISDILQKLQRTSKFRTIPYIESEAPFNEQIIELSKDMDVT